MLGPIVMTVEFPQATLAGTAETLSVRAGHDVEGSTVWASGIDITLVVAGATASSLTGTTGAGGYFTSTITTATLTALKTSAVLPDSVAIDLTADDADSEPVVDSGKAPILEQGLLAVYSTGTSVLEGPVFNGWSANCSAFTNFIYQGECGAGNSPVSWPWGTFSVEWNGYTVANLDTTGGGYSANVSLPARTWVPVNLTFAGNGGSNNMQLGWPASGALGWEAVPRSSLGTPRAWLTAVAGK